MSEQSVKSRPENLVTLVKAVIAILVIVVFLLPPVKQWLNAQPIRLRVIYPLLTLVCLYGLYQAYRATSGAFGLLRWGVIVSAALSSVLAVYGVGQVFFTVGKVCAVAFIVMEIGYILYEGLAGSDDVREGADG